jgi:hypothetical protein
MMSKKSCLKARVGDGLNCIIETIAQNFSKIKNYESGADPPRRNGAGMWWDGMRSSRTDSQLSAEEPSVSGILRAGLPRCLLADWRQNTTFKERGGSLWR